MIIFGEYGYLRMVAIYDHCMVIIVMLIIIWDYIILELSREAVG